MADITVFFTDYTITDKLDLEEEILGQIGAEITWANCKTEEEVLAQIGDPDAVITQWAPVTRRVIESLAKCKVISRNGIGVDNIDVQAAEDNGIAVTNSPAYCIPEVADHAMALMLALQRKLMFTVDEVRGGMWDSAPLVPIRRTKELTLGVIGVGRIGSAVVERGRPFFGRVLGCDIRPIDEEAARLGFEIASHEEVFRGADIITLHVPGTDDTRHMINAEALAMMKPTTYLVNTCRGTVVDTEALVAALQAGNLGGAGLDVHEQEPLPDDHPLRSMANVIITPHVAFYSEEAVEQVRRDTCENIVRLFQGREPISRLV